MQYIENKSLARKRRLKTSVTTGKTETHRRLGNNTHLLDHGFWRSRLFGATAYTHFEGFRCNKEETRKPRL